MSNQQSTKVCGKCKAVKAISDFGKVKGKVRSYCKKCHVLASMTPDLRVEKKCATCKETKSVGEFNRLGNRYQPYCRACQNKYLADVREKRRESGESVVINRKEYFTRKRWRKLFAKYGLTKEQYESLLAEQNGVCAICKKPEQERDGQRKSLLELSVDHDHVTGKVRGLLCRQCNIGLGRLCESVEVLQSAIDYLKKHSAK